MIIAALNVTTNTWKHWDLTQNPFIPRLTYFRPMFFCINIESIRKPQLSWYFQSIASPYPQFPYVSHLSTMENSPRPLFPHVTALVCISSFILNRMARQNKEIQYSRDDSSGQESFSHQKTIKNQSASAWNFLQPQYNCEEVP